VIRRLVGLYPAAWRRRYGEELTELVEATGFTPRTAVDLVRGAARERIRAVRASLLGGASMAFPRAWRHPNGWAVAGLAVLSPTLVFVAASIAAYQLGVTSLLAVTEPLTAWLATARLADLVLVLAPAVALALAVVPLVRVQLPSDSSSPEVIVSIRLRALNVGVALVALGLGALLVWHIVYESVMEVGT
jgi:hypothetical protein